MSEPRPEAESEAAAAGEESPGGRRARRSNPWKVTFVALLIVGLLATAVWVLLGSRLLVVRQIEVSGGERVADAEVVGAVGVATGTPLARVDTDRAARRAEELRLVRGAEVSRGWPATLQVEIVERTPVLSVRVEDGFQLVDADGVVVEDTAERPENRPLVPVRGQVAGNEAVAAAAAVAQALDAATLRAVDSIDATGPEGIRLGLSEGGEVQWGDQERAAEKARILRTLLEAHPPVAGQVYDVSAPDVAVVR